MYSTCILDFDYTLGDSTKGIVQSINFALTTMGRSPEPEDVIRRTIGLSLADTYTALTESRDTGQIEQFTTLFIQKADQVMTESSHLYPDSIKVLTYLKEKGLKTGIVTTKHRYRIREILAKYDANPLVDVVVGREDVKNPKPDPEALRTALQQLDSDNKSVLYIGDSLVDAKTAQGANVDFIGVTTGTILKEDFLAYPCIGVIDSLSELMDNPDLF